MSGKRPVRRKQPSAGKVGLSSSSPSKVLPRPAGYFEVGIEPLEFGVIEVKSEVEEIVVTSQVPDLAALMEMSVNQDGNTAVVPCSSVIMLAESDGNYLGGSSTDERYSCSLCPKRFGRHAALKKHMESHRQEADRRRGRGTPVSVKNIAPVASGKSVSARDSDVLDCDVCKKTFGNERSLRQHVVTHIPAKSHTCAVCNKAFGSRSHLLEHSRVHTGEKPFVCMVCNLGFASASNLRKHLRFHKRRMPYVCSFCLQSYQTNDLLSTHLLVHKGFVCPECKEVLNSRQELESHRLKHGVHDDFRCTSCDEEFRERGDLLGHHVSHVEPDVFVCNECKNHYRYPSELRQHMAEHVSRITPGSDEPVSICLSEDVIDDLLKSKHTKASRHYEITTTQNNNTEVRATLDFDTTLPVCKMENGASDSSDEDRNLSVPVSRTDTTTLNTECVCDICHEKFNTVTDLVSHKVTLHDPSVLEMKPKLASPYNRSKFICLYCSKPFTKRYCLEQHERVHSGERPFSCETCGLTFKQQSQLFKHNVKHTGLKPFVCSYCKKAFSQASYLTEHKRQHTDERPYGCEICGNRFRTNGALRVHNRQHTGAMPYACEVCNRRFKQKANLQKHVQIHTNVRSHNCQICGKGFTDSQALKRHMVMHTGDRPYPCTLCGKTFPAQSSLTIHMKFHRGERKHKCNLCGKAFVVKSHLNRHLHTHNKKDGGVVFGQESVAANYIPIDDDFIIADSFQVEEVVQTT